MFKQTIFNLLEKIKLHPKVPLIRVNTDVSLIRVIFHLR